MYPKTAIHIRICEYEFWLTVSTYVDSEDGQLISASVYTPNGQELVSYKIRGKIVKKIF
jgi:hypothetical protein